jgi:hypothetical protein
VLVSRSAIGYDCLATYIHPPFFFSIFPVAEAFALLGCYTALVGSWSPTFRRGASVGPLGRPETSVTTTNQSCVTSQKSEGLNYTATLAWNPWRLLCKRLPHQNSQSVSWFLRAACHNKSFILEDKNVEGHRYVIILTLHFSCLRFKYTPKHFVLHKDF